jgi:hypothetical protein
MTQRVLNINNTQIVSGTEIMTPGEGGEHTRLLWVSVPSFASQPDVTISIYSDETEANPYPSGKSNPGHTFAPWSIQYIPQGGAGGMDLIAISATNTDVGAPSPVQVVCSYLAIGDESN